MTYPTITIVTPWWNHRELERDYFAAVRTEDCEVLIIDNASKPKLPNAWRLDWNSGSTSSRMALTRICCSPQNMQQASRMPTARPSRWFLRSFMPALSGLPLASAVVCALG